MYINHIGAESLLDHIKLAHLAKRAPVILNPEGSIADAITLMNTHCVSSIVIADADNLPIGIFTERDALHLLATHKLVATDSIRECMSDTLRTAPNDLPFMEGWAIMIEHGIRHLVLIDGEGKITGIVTESDFVRGIAADDYLEPKLVSELMTKCPATLPPTAYVAHALAMMANLNISSIIIVQDHQLCGILTERDAIRLSAFANDLEIIPVQQVMSQPVFHIHPQAPVYDAVALMQTKRVRRLVVLDEFNHIIGILTRHDLVKDIEGRYLKLLRRLVHRQGTELWTVRKQLDEQRVLGTFLDRSALVGIIAADATGHIHLLNETAAQLLDLDRAEAFHYPFVQILHTTGVTSEVLALRLAQLGPSDYFTMNLTVQTTSPPSELYCQICAIAAADEGLAGYLLIIHDRTEERANIWRIRAIFDASPIGIALTDLDGHFTMVNPALLALLGYRDQPDQLLGQHFTCTNAPDDRDDEQQLIQQLIDDERPTYQLEKNYITQDGRQVTVDVTVTAIRDGAGQAAALLLLVVDVSELRRTEQSLRLEQARLKSVIDSTPDLIFFKNLQGIYLGCNRSFNDFIGLGTEQIIGKNDSDLFVAEVAGHQRMIDQQVIATNQASRNEFWLTDVTGQRFLLDVLTTSYFDSDGQQIGVLGVGRDITEMRHNQAVLLEAQAVTGLGTWALDIPTALLTWSNEVYVIFGQDRNTFTLSETTFYNCVYPDDRDRVMTAYRDSVASGQLYDIEHRIVRPDGTIRWVRERARHSFGSDGAPVRSTGTVMDITADRLAKQALEERTQQLDERLKELKALYATVAILTHFDSDPKEALQAIVQLLPSAWQHPEETSAYICVDAIEVMTANFRAHNNAYMQKERIEVDEQQRGCVCIAYNGLTEESTAYQFSPEEQTLLRTIAIEISHCLDRVEANRRLRENEEKYRRIFETIGDAIVVTDATNQIVAINPAFTKITGYSQQEVLGQTPTLLKSGRQDPTFYQNMWNALATSGHWSGELWNRRQDGELYLQRLTIGVVREADGSVREYIGTFSDLTSERQAEHDIEWLTYYDPLTGLPNSKLLTNRLSSLIQQIGHANQCLAVLVIDLDHFQYVVASHGYAAADRALAHIAKRLRNEACPNFESAIVARLAGDSFVVACPMTDETNAANMLAQRLQYLCHRPLDAIGLHGLSITACIGIALYPTDGKEVKHLLRNAESALHRAKEAGRKSIAFYCREMTEAARQRLFLETELRQALEKNQFVLYYQPMFSLKDGQLVGAEALLRWQHPTNGLVPPGLFIDVVENSDLVHPVGRWVIEEAVRQLAAWQQSGLQPVRVSLNISGAMISERDLCAEFTDILDQYHIDASLLEVEVLERVLVKDPEQAMLELSRVRETGIYIALDDFGTGFSSLSYLKRFPVDLLKIDRMFVMNLPDDQDDLAIVRATLSMAHHLGIETIAEGVETQAQLDCLIAEGCDFVQGYFLGRPQPAEQFIEHLKDGYTPYVSKIN
jgi:diguanylate cyclase (GGDEF)-like protein/PAS domain S-box-containing protein